MTSFRSIAGSLGLAIGSIAVTLIVFEILCRTIVDDGMHYHLEMWKYATDLKVISDDPAIGHQHIPNSQAHLMGVDVDINSDGLRDEPISLADEEFRVLMLGDSLTFGWGVPQAETVAARLEQSLEAQLSQSVDVINAGVGNYNTAMEVAWFFRDGLAFEPDAIVLNVFINDAETTPEYEPVSVWDRLLYSRVILFGAWDTISRSLFGGPAWDEYYRNLYDESAPGWREMQAAFKRLSDYSQSAGIPLIVVNYPELRELNPYPFSGIDSKLSRMAESQGVNFVSLLPALESEAPASLWVTPPDPHPNAYATQLISAYLAPRLTDLLALNP